MLFTSLARREATENRSGSLGTKKWGRLGRVGWLNLAAFVI